MKQLIDDALKHSREEPRPIIVREQGKANIVVIGCGGGGCNTINRLSSIGIQGAKLIAVNTDRQHLDMIIANDKILIGKDGLGAGGDPTLGKDAARGCKEILMEVLYNADLVFICAGLGGGTGTGSSPVVAEYAREADAIVVGVVTMPFQVEKGIRQKQAELGLLELRRNCHTVVVIENKKLLELVPDLPLDDALGICDEIVANMVKGITETIMLPSLINLDYADVRTVFMKGGGAIIGIGESSSDNRAEAAVLDALDCPLIDFDYDGATGALVHIAGGMDMTLAEAIRSTELVTEKLDDENAQVLFGARNDPGLGNTMRVTLIITGVQSPNIFGQETRTPFLTKPKIFKGFSRPPADLGLDRI